MPGLRKAFEMAGLGEVIWQRRVITADIIAGNLSFAGDCTRGQCITIRADGGRKSKRSGTAWQREECLQKQS